MSTDKRYSLHARTSKRSRTGVVYYVQFRNADGSYMSAKSTGQATESAAKTWADNYLAKGNVVVKERVRFEVFAEDFYAYEGEYAKHRRLRGKTATRRQLAENARMLKNHVIPHFGKMRLSEIDYDAIASFQIEKLEDGIAGSTVNKFTGVIKQVLEHAQRKKLIQHMPLIERVGARTRQRGILNFDEMRMLFTQCQWPDRRCYVGNLLACFTGCRQGEILALQRKTVHETYITIAHSYSHNWGGMQASTKTGRIRHAHLHPYVSEQLTALLEENPFKHEDAFVFYSHRADRPMGDRELTESLYTAMSTKPLSISEEERRERFIDFHSWRHWFNSYLLNAGVSTHKVQSMTGHLTAEMTERYYHADGYEDVVQALDGVATALQSVDGNKQSKKAQRLTAPKEKL